MKVKDDPQWPAFVCYHSNVAFVSCNGVKENTSAKMKTLQLLGRISRPLDHLVSEADGEEIPSVL